MLAVANPENTTTSTCEVFKRFGSLTAVDAWI
jgi:hypothetical protein